MPDTKKKQPLTELQQAEALGSQHGSGRVGGQVGAPGSALPQPVNDFLSKVGNTLEIPMTLIGAAQMDWDRGDHRSALALINAVGGGWFGGINPNGSLSHAVRMISRNQFGAAAQLYSTTSLDANKQRAALGDRGAQYFQHHPAQFGTAAFAEEFANPANIATGKLFGELAEVAPATKFNRFADVRRAAEQAPADRAAAPTAAAREAAERAQARRAAANERNTVEGNPRGAAGRAEHFAQKQAASARAQAAKAQMDAHNAAHEAGMRTALPRAQNARVLPPAEGPAEAQFRPNEPIAAPGAGPPPNQLALPFGRFELPPPSATPALPPAGEARLALPPGGATEAPLQNAMRQLITRMKQNARPKKPAPPIAAGPLTPPGPVGGKAALPPPETVPGPTLAQGEGFGMSAPPGAPGAPELARPSTVYRDVPPPSGGAPELGAAPPGQLPSEPRTPIAPSEPAITTPGSHLAQAPPGGPPVATPPEFPPAPTPDRPMMTKDVADSAERVFRRMITEAAGANNKSATITRNLYKGLPLEQAQQLFDTIEGEEPMRPEYANRIAQYQGEQRAINPQLTELGLAREEDLMNPDFYHPRTGATKDSMLSDGERPFEPPSIQKVNPEGSKRRPFATRKEAARQGELMNPEWEPATALEPTLRKRLYSISLERGMRELQDLGLIVPPEVPRPPGWETIENLPDIAKFGSPTINSGAAFHPAIAKAIRDITATSMNPKAMLSAPTAIGRVLDWINSAAARWETSQPIFHPVVNVGPNQLATLATHTNPLVTYPEYFKQLLTVEGAKNPLDYAKKLITGQGLGDAVGAGASVPYASQIPESQMLRPWSDLRGAGERWQRVKNLIDRGVENVTSRPLYQTIEPRMARAAYKALQKGGVSEPKAALLTRQTVGEPENLAAVMKPGSRNFMFPTWRYAMGRLWPYLLGKAPAFYMAPHRGIEAFNRSRGVVPQPSDSAKLIPGIAAPWKSPQGYPQTFTFPSPANIPLQAMDLLGSSALRLSGDQAQTNEQLSSMGLRLALTLLNPLWSTGVRGVGTMTGKSGEPGTGIAGYRLYDKDAPSAQPPPWMPGPLKGPATAAESLRAIFGETAGRYAPVKANPTGPLEALGLGLQAHEPEQKYEQRNREESKYRKRIAKLQIEAENAQKAGNTTLAAQKRAHATWEYQKLEARIQERHLNPPP